MIQACNGRVNVECADKSPNGTVGDDLRYVVVGGREQDSETTR